MKFSREDVQKLADLARIELSEEEGERMKKTLGDILEYVEKIGEVDVSEVSDTESLLEPTVREDVEQGCEPQIVSRIVSQFPDRENDALVVPGVFEEPKG